jgi:GDP-L-fucose synthase
MKIFIAGHKGLVGSAILRQLKKRTKYSILTVERKNLDLLDQDKVYSFLKKNKPDNVIIAAARVGGILANQNYGGEFIYENLQIQNNLIHGSYSNGIKNLIFLGSSCIYPKKSKQPIKEEYLLSGKLEQTNEPYAVAKIAGVKMCEAYNSQFGTNYKCIMPANTYGPNDHYDLKNSHFFAALIRKAHECKIKNKKKFEIWGTGKPFRELIYVDDVADACIFFMKKKIKDTLLNIGTGKDYTINYYANFIKKKMNLNSIIKFDKTKPDGVERKVLNISKATSYGWKPKISLDEGFDKTYASYKELILK